MKFLSCCIEIDLTKEEDLAEFEIRTELVLDTRFRQDLRFVFLGR